MMYKEGNACLEGKIRSSVFDALFLLYIIRQLRGVITNWFAIYLKFREDVWARDTNLKAVCTQIIVKAIIYCCITKV